MVSGIMTEQKQMTNDKKIHFSLEVSLYGQVKRETSVTTVISYTMALIDQFNTRPLPTSFPGSFLSPKRGKRREERAWERGWATSF